MATKYGGIYPFTYEEISRIRREQIVSHLSRRGITGEVASRLAAEIIRLNPQPPR